MATELRPPQSFITTGSSSNNTLATKGYVDDIAGAGFGIRDTLPVATPGQTAFTLSSTPTSVTNSMLVLNGQIRFYGVGNDYTISGTTLTWINTSISLQTTDVLQVWYDIQLGTKPPEWNTHAGTLPAAGANLVVTAASLGLTDARQIVMSQLMGKGTDQNWWFAGNTWGGATHDFNYTIPTGGDPNLGNLVIQVSGTATTVASQPYEFIYWYQETNFLS
jgi:hypothetical protein